MGTLAGVARPTVLILGGYGAFGRRIAANLARRTEIDLVIAGRNAGAAATLARSLGVARVRSLAVDLGQAAALTALISARPTVIVDTLGPFQSRNLALPRRCAERGIHYVDIADARARVADIASLDAAARVEHAAIVSGASTMPAFTTAIVDELAPNPREVVSIDVGITTGSAAPGGHATASSVLGYCGREIPAIGNAEVIYGWGGLARQPYPEPVGERWLSNIDAPERALWRARYPALEEMTIRAGLESSLAHLGLTALSRGVRHHLLPGLAGSAKTLVKLATFFDRFSGGAGAMHVQVTTRDAHARAASRAAVVVAEDGDGPEVAAAPAAAIVKKLLALPGYAPLEKRGAFPCVGILTREEIMRELADFSVRYEGAYEGAGS